MTFEELEHAIRAACDVAGDTEVVVFGENTGWCLDGDDLAASKLAAFRQKDREFVRILLREKYVTARKLIARIRLLPLKEGIRQKLAKWVDLTARELRSGL